MTDLSRTIAPKSDQLNARLGELDALRDARLAPFYKARQRYFE